MRRRAVLGLALLAACGRPGAERAPPPATPLYPNETPELRALIERAAALHEIPVSLIQRVIVRESTHRPDAINPTGPYYGLMQILPATARAMGHRGPPSELLDPWTNLLYAGRYLRGAWLVAEGNEPEAVQWYARGYYYEAKRMGLLEEVGLG